MGNTLNIALTNELRAFIDKNSGENTLYATPSEFLRNLIREKKERMEAAEIRNKILDGYQDISKGHYIAYEGDLRATMLKAAEYRKKGWKS